MAHFAGGGPLAELGGVHGLAIVWDLCESSESHRDFWGASHGSDARNHLLGRAVCPFRDRVGAGGRFEAVEWKSEFGTIAAFRNVGATGSHNPLCPMPWE